MSNETKIKEVRNILGDNIGFVKLVDSMGDDMTIVNSARVSYNNNDDEKEIITTKDKKLIKYLIENNHSSPLEHVTFTFNICVPLPIERQWQRHRTWKYFSLNEVSRRYTSDGLTFYNPTIYRTQNNDNKQMSTDQVLCEADNMFAHKEMEMLIEHCVTVYDIMLRLGVAREQARLALPQAMYTNFYASVDLHNLLWFLELREHEHAQWEIVQYAKAIKKLIGNVVPETLKIWNKSRGEN